jgi:hypothetical protein
MFPFGVTGPTKGSPGTNFIKKSWNAAKQARIFQAVAVPKKIGCQIDQTVAKSPSWVERVQKAWKDPSKAVAVYQNTKTAGGQRVKNVRGIK